MRIARVLCSMLLVPLLAAALLGCRRDGVGGGDAGPACVHTASHGGALVALKARSDPEWAHIEFVFEPGAGTLDAYVTGADAVTPVRLKQHTLPIDLYTGKSQFSLELEAVADPQTGEVMGDSSRFSVADSRLVNLPFFEAIVRAVSVNGEDIQGAMTRYRREPPNR